MSQRYVTVTVETRASEDDVLGEEITAIYNLDLEEDADYIDGQVHEDLHDHLLNLLEQYGGGDA
ncbi:MAG: hypothetical protein OXH13_04430 [Chloroflexi bacterium]|nr:hypothetical protein [Chloroflexota bacterium]MCY3572288.1 hypothetical protein [Chloroflexota bacterium]MCY3684577.1 hypothetical protein [Chloroflexota bacterium]MCY3696059.1 hypothetical protein [Chloroflexota bacterium]